MMMTINDDIMRQKGMYKFIADFETEFRKRYGDNFKIIVKPTRKNKKRWRKIRARRYR